MYKFDICYKMFLSQQSMLHAHSISFDQSVFCTLIFIIIMKSNLSLYIDSHHSCLFGYFFLNIHVPVFNICSLRLQFFLFVYCASVEEHQEPVTEYLQSRIDNFSLSLTIELNYFILLLSNFLSP